MSAVDIIFYINLESRTDRKEHFLNEITKLTSDMTKVIRIDAIKDKFGALGCTYSHIKAIEEFERNPEWKTCIIFEDDFTFKNADSEINNRYISTFMKEFPDWDVLALSHNDTKSSVTHHSDYIKLQMSRTASGYCLNKKFAPILKANFLESSHIFRSINQYMGEFALDTYWWRLMPLSNWFAVIPSMGYQCAGYSDITECHVEYNC